MRSMTPVEILCLLDELTWGTLCTILPQGTPYAAEATYLYRDDEIICLSHSQGMTGDRIRHCPSVCFKVCESHRLSRYFRAVTLFGTAAFVEPQNGHEMVRLWEQIEQRLKSPDLYPKPKQHCRNEGKLYPVLRIKVDHRSAATDLDHCHE